MTSSVTPGAASSTRTVPSPGAVTSGTSAGPPCPAPAGRARPGPRSGRSRPPHDRRRAEVGRGPARGPLPQKGVRHRALGPPPLPGQEELLDPFGLGFVAVAAEQLVVEVAPLGAHAADVQRDRKST